MSRSNTYKDYWWRIDHEEDSSIVSIIKSGNVIARKVLNRNGIFGKRSKKKMEKTGEKWAKKQIDLVTK